MAGTVEEIMTRDPRTVEIGDSLVAPRARCATVTSAT